MTRRSTSRGGSVFVLLSLFGAPALAAGCAGGTSSDFGQGGSHGSAGLFGGGSAASTSASNSINPGNGSNQIGAQSPPSGDGAPDDALPDGACAQSVTETKISPVYLVFMFDRSGSMADSVGGGLTRWTAVVPALEAFFADPKSSGISASLQFFAQPSECVVSDYATPLVPMTSLPNATVFSSAITAVGKPNGDTPTQPALQGAIQYARTVQSQDPGSHAAVVLVTDGEPHDSCGSTVADVATAAQTGDTATPAVPTYVVGIGKSLTSLNLIAQAGGTQQAFFVATANNPDAGGTASQTETDFVDALSAIRESQSTCNLPLPTPPTGQALDYGKVNVLATGAGGGQQTLNYNGDCGADGGVTDGWHYDDVQMPTAIVLCPSSCDAVQIDATTQLNVELGCKTQGTIPR